MGYLLEMKKITKKFPGVTALKDINFQLRPGEVHVLLGENGAGKSTLVKILSGVYEPTEGTIVINGKEYAKLTPKESIENKISIIYQEISLIDELSIGENIYVGKLPTKKLFNMTVVDYKQVEKNTRELLKKVGLNKEPSVLAKELSISEKQQVEIAKALSYDAKVIIMDEPTSSLTIEETNKLFEIIKQLKNEGVGIIYISHKLNEIKEIGDRVTVLKDGTYVGTRDVRDVEIEELVTMMVGRELKSKYMNAGHRQKGTKEVVFKVSNLTRADKRVRNVSFEVYKGEILGFAGLIGSGRTELMNAIFGADKIDSGEIHLFGEQLAIKSPYQAIKKGMALITENRRETGFFPNFEIWKNVSIELLIKESKLGGIWGLLNRSKERDYAKKQKDLLNIKCSSIDQNITELSGGNQQKVIVGKWLAAESKLIIFDEPTKGIDIGAKSEIYNIMRELSDNGKAVIMVSSELPELLAVCDRIAVFREGELRTILTSDEATEEKILLAATSAK
jgi:D-allose transport system ATP-binding protein